jgi:AraC-like DNA-binding protein
MINTIPTEIFCSRLEHSSPSPGRRSGCAPARDVPAPHSNGRGDGGSGLEGVLDANAARKVEKALAYMMAHQRKPIRISALGALSAVSTSYFYHLFKLATGRTPNDFLIRSRMRRACELLLDPALSIKEVADASGYNDPLYFSRVFRSVYGLPPRGYRILMAGRASAGSKLPFVSCEARTCGNLAGPMREGRPTAAPALKAWAEKQI